MTVVSRFVGRSAQWHRHAIVAFAFREHTVRTLQWLNFHLHLVG